MDKPLIWMIENAPSVVAVVAAILLALELGDFVRRRRAGSSGGVSARFAIGVTLTTVIFFLTLFLRWEPKTPWVLWVEGVEASATDCQADNARRIVAAKTTREALGLDCLALALNAHPMPTEPVRIALTDAGSTEYVGQSNIEALLRAHYAGSLLMRSEPVARILSQSLGLHTNLFLGTGYTLPSYDPRSVTQSSNFRPGIREYLVRNYCVSESRSCSESGTERLSRAWTWSFARDEFKAARGLPTIGALVSSKPPNLSEPAVAAAWTGDFRQSAVAYAGGAADPLDRYLIRFAQFPLSAYKGTLAKPSRSHAFFADIRDVWNLSYDEAEIQSGKVANDADSSVVLVWVISLSSNNLKQSGLATWHYVFDIMRRRAAEIDDPDSYGV